VSRARKAEARASYGKVALLVRGEARLGGLRGFGTFLAIATAWALALSLWARPALAVQNSELEERSVTRALGPHPDRDDAPDGKRIQAVEIVRLPVFDDDDPVPDLFNIFHAQTREHAIRRELLFQPGERYDAERVQETLRNLQLLPQFGVVVIVTLRGTEPGQVRVVVIVRDVWSLRLNYQFQGTSNGINYLFVNLSEDNLLGTRTRVGSLFTLQPDRYSLGALAVHPRVAGSKVDAYALGRVFVNLETGQAEGSQATLSVYRSLISLADKWAFLAGAGWTIDRRASTPTADSSSRQRACRLRTTPAWCVAGARSRARLVNARSSI